MPSTGHMAAMFHFAVDPVRNFVRIEMSGFFVADDIGRFIEAQDEAYQQLRCAPNQHVTLVDMRQMEIQPQLSVNAFQARMGDPKIAAQRIAFVVSRSLARLQIKRATEGLPANLFLTEAEAIEWLMAA